MAPMLSSGPSRAREGALAPVASSVCLRLRTTAGDLDLVVGLQSLYRAVRGLLDAAVTEQNWKAAVALAGEARSGLGAGLAEYLGYFLGLGTWGFGGPIATVGYMQRDLVDSAYPAWGSIGGGSPILQRTETRNSAYAQLALSNSTARFPFAFTVK